MASFDNMMAVEQPWMIRPEIFGSWIPDAFAAEGMGMSLQYSSFAAASDNSSYGSPSSYALSDDQLLESMFVTPAVATPAMESAKEGAAVAVAESKPRRRSVAQAVAPSGRIAKRKSRAKKKGATTTFITADPANFRQMVQQVTGAKFAGAEEAAAAWRPVAVNPIEVGGGLTTLDTSSAFFLDGSGSSLASQQSAEGGGSGGAAEHYVDSFCSFPTLESWKAS